jgi:hypothetical protein
MVCQGVAARLHPALWCNLLAEFATDGTARALQRTFTGLVPGAFGMIDSGNLCDRINAFRYLTICEKSSLNMV